MDQLQESGWRKLLNIFLSEKGGPTFGEAVYLFEDEVKTSRFIHGTEAIRNVFAGWISQLPFVTEYKEQVSDEFRRQGNVLFTSSQDISEAALLYTKAIYTANANTTSLALAHANRAAALYKLGEFEAAYYDCECALSLGHPKPDIILLRKATCAEALQDVIKLKATLNVLECCSFKPKQSVEELKKSIASLEVATLSPPFIESKSREFIEKKQKILRDAVRGRFVVASEPIAPDETIMAEEAVAFVPICNTSCPIFPDVGHHYLNFTCSCCAENDIVPFPCSSCRNVSYCSPKCREKHSSVHSVECYGYRVDLFFQIGIGHLALRCLLVAFTEILQDVAKKEQSKLYKRAEELWPDITETGHDGDLMGLCTNFKFKQKDKDLVHYALTASMLCCYLRDKTDFFVHTHHARNALMSSEFEWELLITALLLRLTNQMICNAHTIEGLVIQKPFMQPTFKQGEISSAIHEGSLFSAIYPRVSLYNHSCESNFMNKFDKAKLLAIAKTRIRLNEEIFNCYGISCRSMNRLERKNALEHQYGFDCNCNYCRDESDKAYFQTHFKICNKPTCQTRYLVEKRNGCTKCNTPFDETEYQHFLNSIERLNDSLKDYERVYDSLLHLQHMFPPQTIPRMHALASILKNFVECGTKKLIQNNDIVRKMITLAVDLLGTTKAIYGIHDLLFIQNASYLLDIISLRKSGDHDFISRCYDVGEIQGSFSEVLTGRIKRKFEIYFEKYIK